ncbi:hypothetical protein GCM10009127_24570 [Alteraurantiacibacter aestuarii]|uniref:hypothetical protein n=1 Tax=Alteraurantiacibacter aestuarii TaxID=650004 RepID=UPI0031DD2DF6
MFDLVLAITMLSAAALLAGAVYLWRKKGNVRQATLMAVLAFVMLANVVIWTLPVASGEGDAGTSLAGSADTDANP